MKQEELLFERIVIAHYKQPRKYHTYIILLLAAAVIFLALQI